MGILTVTVKLNFYICLHAQVTVVESRDRVGGRVWDDNKSLGCCVGRGAQILNGCVNNPVSVLCEQVMAVTYRRCVLLFSFVFFF